MPAEPDIEIVILDPAWQRDLPGAAACCRSAARAALAAEIGAGEPAALVVALAADATVRDLNRAFRGKDRPTNVLSFPDLTPTPPGEARTLGEVVLARETVLAEAAAQGKPAAEHLAHLVVHGVLHLLGYDHQVEEEAVAMEALEVQVLASLGISDPYAGDPAVSIAEAGAQ